MNNKLSKIIFSKKAFLWDFDGCLCDSEEIHYEAYAKAFRHFGHEVNKNEYFNTFTHTGGGILAEIANYNLICNPEEIKHLKSLYYFDLIKNSPVHLFPEIVKILNKLKANGIKSMIASNSPQLEIETILSKNNALNLFSGIVGLQKHLRKKPAPDIFLAALSKLELDPQEAMVIEDSERGLQAAQAAGCDAIWIKTRINEKFTTLAPHLAELTHQELLSYVDG